MEVADEFECASSGPVHWPLCCGETVPLSLSDVAIQFEITSLEKAAILSEVVIEKSRRRRVSAHFVFAETTDLLILVAQMAPSHGW